jgi:hypothetical protein
VAGALLQPIDDTLRVPDPASSDVGHDRMAGVRDGARLGRDSG